MLSIEKCYELLNKNRKRYTIEETREIRKSLYQIADIIYESKQRKDEEIKRETSSTLRKS
jgi:hypothetical protein